MPVLDLDGGVDHKVFGRRVGAWGERSDQAVPKDSLHLLLDFLGVVHRRVGLRPHPLFFLLRAPRDLVGGIQDDLVAQALVGDAHVGEELADEFVLLSLLLSLELLLLHLETLVLPVLLSLLLPDLGRLVLLLKGVFHGDFHSHLDLVECRSCPRLAQQSSHCSAHLHELLLRRHLGVLVVHPHRGHHHSKGLRVRVHDAGSQAFAVHPLPG
mmetsp:Transcript_1155/g.2076  ORF Transcript_1155/g.2076 Transcript_1155/m.2076 type:complete len:212 (-) Transcript_1155:115-750(-)